jgi:hypothetical protein
VVVTKDTLTETPVPMKRSELTMAGGTVQVVGYGRSVAGDSNSSGTKRSASATIGSRSYDLIAMNGAPNNMCEGDSGGPSFDSDVSGPPQVLGVHFGVQNGSTCTGNQYDTAVYQFAASFVDPLIEAADPGWLVIPDAGTSGGGARGCGCASTGGAAALLALAVLLRGARRTS